MWPRTYLCGMFRRLRLSRLLIWGRVRVSCVIWGPEARMDAGPGLAKCWKLWVYAGFGVTRTERSYWSSSLIIRCIARLTTLLVFGILVGGTSLKCWRSRSGSNLSEPPILMLGRSPRADASYTQLGLLFKNTATCFTSHKLGIDCSLFISNISMAQG
jgi:hypothetical protein